MGNVFKDAQLGLVKPKKLFEFKRNQDGSESPVIKPKKEKSKFDPSRLVIANKDQIKQYEEAFEDDTPIEDAGKKGDTSSALDAFVGAFDKQAAMFGLLANGLGLVSDEEIAPFIAEHSTRLHNAQKHAPEYMKEFQKDYAEARGFWQSAGVIITNPRAIGRLVIESAPNSAAPLTLGFAGGAIGSAVPFVGSIVGFATGTFAGGSMVEIGAWMDQEIQKTGIDVTDPDDILKVLQDDEFMDRIASEAKKKGISTAAVDTLFTLFGGKLLAGVGKGLPKKAVAFAGEQVIEGTGEFLGEATGQRIATGKIDLKSSALEGVAGFAQSTGQTAFLSTARIARGKETILGQKKKEQADKKKEEKGEAKGNASKSDKPEGGKDSRDKNNVKNMGKEAVDKLINEEDIKDNIKEFQEEKSQEKIVEEEEDEFDIDFSNESQVNGLLETIEKGSKKLIKYVFNYGGESNFKNTLSRAFYTAKKKFMAIQPMNVIFDLMDVGESFKGVNFKFFKARMNLANRKRAEHKESVEKPILAFHEEAGLTVEDYKRILIIATLEQDKSLLEQDKSLKGGKKKPRNPGRDKLRRTFSTAQLHQFEEEGLTPNQSKMLDLMQQEFEKLKEPLRNILEERYDKEFKDVVDFFPMLTDFDAMDDYEIQDMFGPDAPLFDDLEEVSVNFLKKRKGGAIPIKTNALNVFLNYVDNATYLINMTEHIQNSFVIAKHKRYREAVGIDGQKAVIDWLKLMARKGGAGGTRVPILDTLRKNASVALLGYKLSAILIQPTALFEGAALIGNHAFKGLKNITFGPKSAEWKKFLKKHFTELRLRAGDDPAYSAFLDDNLDESVFGNIKKYAFSGVRALDGITASAIAAGAYEKIVTAKGNKVDFANPDHDAIIEAELIVSRSQASGQYIDLPAAVSQGALTGNASIDEAITQFQTFAFGRASMFVQTIGKNGFKNTPELRNMATFVMLALIAETFVRKGVEELVSMLDGDDDDLRKDGFLERLVFEGISSIPIVGQSVNAVRYASFPIPVIGLAQRAIDNAGIAISTEDDKKKMLSVARAIMELSGLIGGVPGTSQIEQIVKDVYRD